MTNKEITTDNLSPEHSSECQPDSKNKPDVPSRRAFLKTGAVSILGVAAVAAQLNDAKLNAKGGETDRLITAYEKKEMVAKLDALYPVDTTVAVSRLSPEERLAKLQQEAEAGNATAQYLLGVAYATGQAFTLEMAELDRPLAQYAEKFGIPDKSSLGLAHSADPVDWYQKAAAQGHGDALFMLGMISANCDDVDRDITKSAEWFAKAASQGHCDAQFKLGAMYANGDGVPEDAAKAAEWWQKAAGQGHVSALAKLGNA